MSIDTIEQSANRLCTQCGYDLRGLSDGGDCPECGMSIAMQGDHLSMSPPDWLGRMRVASLVRVGAVAASYVISVDRVMLQPPGAGRSYLLPWWAAYSVIAAFELFALFLLTSREPRALRGSGQIDARLWVRIGAAIEMLGRVVIVVVLQFVLVGRSTYVGLLFVLGGVVFGGFGLSALIALFVVMRQFARRGQSFALATYTMCAMVFGIVCTSLYLLEYLIIALNELASASLYDMYEFVEIGARGTWLVFGVMDVILMLLFYRLFSRSLRERERWEGETLPESGES